MARRLVTALTAAAAVLATLSAAAAAPPDSMKTRSPVSYVCSGGITLSGTATEKWLTQVPYTELADGLWNWKYTSSTTATLSDAAGLVYTLSETYAYNHATKVNKPGTSTTIMDSYSWVQTLTDPTGVATTGMFGQTLVTVNGVQTQFSSVSGPFPWEVA